THNDDEDMTREPEMVKAYRDTWELGLHSYLTYMRDRLLLARELLTPSGSVFVQISDENVHHVRELMDEVFGAENFCAVITFVKTVGSTSELLPGSSDYLLWYARDRTRAKFREVFVESPLTESVWTSGYNHIELPTRERRRLSELERRNPYALPEGARLFKPADPTSQRQGRPSGPGSAMHFAVRVGDVDYFPSGQRGWTTTSDGMQGLVGLGRLLPIGNTLSFVRYLSDFPFRPLTNAWDDTSIAGFAADKLYVVQTSTKVLQRCILMTTDPGDLVLDPTCGSGTTAYVAEQWGRRWISIDTSRVPLALARQRLLTATFPWYELKDGTRGPAGGFVYRRKQNKKGEEVGGIVPHVTLKSIANNEPPDEEVLVDRPEIDNKFVRVTGPFAVEATIPTPVDWEEDGVEDSGAEAAEEYGSFVERMIEVLRRSPVLHVGGGKTVKLWNVRRPAKTLSLSAEALAGENDEQPVAFVFGPENGTVSEKLVHAALKEADIKRYAHLYVIGFGIQAHARELVEKSTDAGFPPATYVQATPDLMMGDLLKTMRSSQIFSVCGLPEVSVHVVKPDKKGEPTRYQVELLGLDTFDPATMKPDHRRGDDVPAWFLDTDYNDLCFHVSQAFFPRTGAWQGLRKAL
ncbi:MAG: site-specific DNA-methyltransferase, partial [Desulfobacterales bacterium]|nr:site-specific DNA-methyltransferase [Desulfobacterales bacterium]